jgi:UDP-N-acetylmuramoylalanine--D-glutamate ligase
MPAVWVLELSSYQLETTWSLKPNAAAMLNLTEDHFDRYAGMADYAAAKARVFFGQGEQVLNRDDPRSMAMRLGGRKAVTFGLDAPPSEDDFGVRERALVMGDNPILEQSALPIHGAHNVANALAACALARAAGVALQELGSGLRSFHGLPHRLELVATRHGVDWFDDSKGTNVGATIAALKGLGREVVLILGGEGKGQDFSPLRESVAQFASHVLLIGRDAPLIEKVLVNIKSETCQTLESAVQRAAELAHPGEAVLLSPACASFDMFRDYKHRGEAFAAAVKGLGSRAPPTFSRAPRPMRSTTARSRGLRCSSQRSASSWSIPPPSPRPKRAATPDTTLRGTSRARRCSCARRSAPPSWCFWSRRAGGRRSRRRCFFSASYSSCSC